MSNLELTYTPYLTKLKKPFRTSGVTITERQGFILILKSGSKSIGIGEAAPLPEFGSETYEETEKALANFNLKLSIELDNIESSITKNLEEYDNLPSLKCGLELAILKLLCSERNTSIPALLKRDYSESVLVNSVIGLINPDDAEELAAYLIKKGFRTLKIKVGRDDFKDDYKIIKVIKESVGEDINIRLDANAKWKKDEAVEYLTMLEPFDIQYVEQPVKDLDDFIFLKEKVKIPLAADESIRTIDNAESFILSRAADYIILKPMMLGGIIPTLKIVDFAKLNDLETVVTSSFEGVIGRIGAVNAAAFINNELAHGLATADYFDEENIPDPFPVSDGKIKFQE